MKLTLLAVLSASLMANTTPVEGFKSVKEFKKAFYQSHVEWFNAVQSCSNDKSIKTKEGVGVCLETFTETRDIRESIKYGSYMVSGQTLTKDDSKALVGAAKLDLYITKECLDMKEVKNVQDVVDCRKIIEKDIRDSL